MWAQGCQHRLQVLRGKRWACGLERLLSPLGSKMTCLARLFGSSYSLACDHRGPGGPVRRRPSPTQLLLAWGSGLCLTSVLGGLLFPCSCRRGPGVRGAAAWSIPEVTVESPASWWSAGGQTLPKPTHQWF